MMSYSQLPDKTIQEKNFCEQNIYSEQQNPKSEMSEMWNILSENEEVEVEVEEEEEEEYEIDDEIIACFGRNRKPLKIPTDSGSGDDDGCAF